MLNHEIDTVGRANLIGNLFEFAKNIFRIL